MAVTASDGITHDELRLAARNHAMPLEALSWPVTPVGLHYLLIHYDVPVVAPAEWRLIVGGAVDRPLELDLDQIRARPSIDLTTTMECAGNGRALLEPRPLSQPWLTEAVGTATWTGVPLADLLEEAGLTTGATDVVLTGADHGVEGGVAQAYERSLDLATAMTAGAVLAYAMNGSALPPQHGYPLRAVVPGWYGMANVKWLARITVTEERFSGYQMDVAYRFRQTEGEPGRPVTLMLPRSLMVPPGVPDFYTRRRVVGMGRIRLTGRAWSGRGPIVGVEVSDDGGSTWMETMLVSDVPSPWAWTGWWCEWEPLGPGEHVLCCRATDVTGESQPMEPVWNLGGYENNAVQRVLVTVV